MIQETDYPRSGKIRLFVMYPGEKPVRVGIRIPSWCDEYVVVHNGNRLTAEVHNGYVFVEIQDGDYIDLEMEMTAVRWYANLNVSDDVGKVAIARGPIVYCLEQVDNGEKLQSLYFLKTQSLNIMVNFL